VPFLSDTRLEAALLPVLDSAIDATAADFGNIQLRTREGNQLKIVVQRGFQQPFLEFFAIVSGETSCCGKAMVGGWRVIVSDVEASAIFTEAGRKTMLDAGALACQSTPITGTGGTVLGMLNTHFRTPHRPLRCQLARVDTLSCQIAELLQSPEADSRVDDVAKAIEEYRERSTKTRVIPRRRR
jgi:hypothetical protein